MPNQKFPPGFRRKNKDVMCGTGNPHTLFTRSIDNTGASGFSRAHHRIKTYKNQHKPCDYSWEHDSTATGKPLEDHLQKAYRLVAARLHPWTPSGRIQNPLVVQVWEDILTAWERSVSESMGKGVRVLCTPQMGLEMHTHSRMSHGRSGEGGDDDDDGKEDGSSHTKHIM